MLPVSLGTPDPRSHAPTLAPDSLVRDGARARCPGRLRRGPLGPRLGRRRQGRDVRSARRHDRRRQRGGRRAHRRRPGGRAASRRDVRAHPRRQPRRLRSAHAGAARGLRRGRACLRRRRGRRRVRRPARPPDVRRQGGRRVAAALRIRPPGADRRRRRQPVPAPAGAGALAGPGRPPVRRPLRDRRVAGRGRDGARRGRHQPALGAGAESFGAERSGPTPAETRPSRPRGATGSSRRRRARATG